MSTKRYVIEVNEGQNVRGFSVHVNTETLGGQSYYIPADKVEVEKQPEPEEDLRALKFALVIDDPEFCHTCPCCSKDMICQATGNNVEQLRRGDDSDCPLKAIWLTNKQCEELGAAIFVAIQKKLIEGPRRELDEEGKIYGDIGEDKTVQ